MAHDREVAGIRCGEVLEILPDYVEGTLDPEQLEQVQAHLAGCDWCERFGGAYAGTVGSLRRELGAAPPLTEGQAGRLRGGGFEGDASRRRRGLRVCRDPFFGREPGYDP